MRTVHKVPKSFPNSHILKSKKNLSKSFSLKLIYESYSNETGLGTFLGEEVEAIKICFHRR
jgi:hypothetical protein